MLTLFFREVYPNEKTASALRSGVNLKYMINQ